LRDEPLEGRAVVARAIEVQPGAVVFAASELVGVAVRRAADRGRAEGLVGVAGRNRPAGTDESYRGAKCIGQEGRGCGVGPREILVDAQSREQVGRRAGRSSTVELLHWIEAVVQELRRRAVNGLVHPPSESIGKRSKRLQNHLPVRLKTTALP